MPAFGTLLFSPTGRLTRRVFWPLSLAAWLTFVLLYQGLEATFGSASTLVVYPIFIWVLWALCCKRYRDIDKSPLWLLIVVLPIVGPLWAFADLGLRKGTTGINRYGPDPRDLDGEYLVVNT